MSVDYFVNPSATSIPFVKISQKSIGNLTGIFIVRFPRIGRPFLFIYATVPAIPPMIAVQVRSFFISKSPSVQNTKDTIIVSLYHSSQDNTTNLWHGTLCIVLSAIVDYVFRLLRILSLCDIRDLPHNLAPQIGCITGRTAHYSIVVGSDPERRGVLRCESNEPVIVVVVCGSCFTTYLGAINRCAPSYAP